MCCHIGLTGTNCSEKINACENDPCQNGGTCLDGIGNYSCLCVTEFVDLRLYAGNIYEYGLLFDLFNCAYETVI